MQKFKIARFVLHPVTGTENDALRIDNALFDVHEIWYASNCTLFYSEFVDLHPSEMAEIAIKLFDAGLLAKIK